MGRWDSWPDFKMKYWIFLICFDTGYDFLITEKTVKCGAKPVIGPFKNKKEARGAWLLLGRPGKILIERAFRNVTTIQGTNLYFANEGVYVDQTAWKDPFNPKT